ncbi:hypothetical protein TIFTF001_039678 [Ficus carica]|uniref:Uncharacterized protein n=1 Tax=Ficus carica TaxID=3494 RepID=A0AA88E9K8_FICCA|nr:hypothetical protein TIFTF001_039678 [Ficus carica]
MACRQLPMGESLTPKITKKIAKNCKENHRKLWRKSDHGHPSSSPSAGDLQPPCTGFSEHALFFGDGHLCGGFGGLEIWIRGLFYDF